MINGSRLKELRLKNGYTLAKLSSEIGCTASYLSQIERGIKEPSLSMIRKLSNSFSKPIFYFLTPDNQYPTPLTASYSIVRATERPTLTTHGLSIQGEAITACREQNNKHRMWGAIYHMDPGSFASEGLISHRFDECIYVICGQVEVLLNDNSERIQTGDCIYINESTLHNIRNSGNSQAILLSFNN